MPTVFNAWPLVVGEDVGGGITLIPGGGFTHVTNASVSYSTRFLLEAVSSVTVVVRVRMAAVCLLIMSNFATAAYTREPKDPLIFLPILSRVLCSALVTMVAEFA